jgi:protease I
MKKALILTYTGFQDQEVIYPYYRLLGANYKVDIIADKRDENNRVYGIFGVNMPCHILIKDFIMNILFYLDSYDILVLPGGVKSLEKLRQIQPVLDFINDWNQRGKLIASTCHGGQLLISAKVVKGRRISGYYSIKDDINNAGAIYTNEPYVIDTNIISSPHYDHMGIWMEKVIEHVI